MAPLGGALALINIASPGLLFMGSVPSTVGEVGQFVGSLLFGCFHLGIIGFLAYGAWKMRTLQNYGLSVASATIMCIPCLAPCCPFGIPIGIWALIVLNKPEVKEAFETKRRRSDTLS